MIFDIKTNAYETRADKPCENWTGDPKWQVIPDGSYLAKKIIANYPFFEPVIEYGVCVDINPTERIEPEPSAEETISGLKEQLEQSDYKIIKCSECQLAGLDLPYDIEALHEERQALRDEINRLEEET